MLAAPGAGATELLRQSFDTPLPEAWAASPIYFQWTARDRTAAVAARRFLHAFLSSSSRTAATTRPTSTRRRRLRDLIDLVDPSDYEWIERLV